LTESFLHYVWQFQYFDKKSLTTSVNESIQVFHPGVRNTHAGPDFSDARIRIGDLEWRGSVEIHIKASGWTDHHHDDDAAYEKVILHVVWENDKPIIRSDGSPMPTLELKDRADLSLWSSYKKLFTSAETIPCSGSFASVPDILKMSMLDKALTQRLQSKANAVLEILNYNQGSWEETAYQLLFRNFGFKVNADPFLQLAKALPYKVIQKHADQPIQVEALLFGQAGFLEIINPDEYAALLIREYSILSTKFNLSDQKLHFSQWRFLRLRPANFPTVRLAQLASLLTNKKSLFNQFIEAESCKELMKQFTVEQSPYWQNHYLFGQETSKAPPLGKGSIQNIMINTTIPLLAAYSVTHDDQHYMDRAVEWLQHIPAEKNIILRQWQSVGCRVKTAFDSQALIELFNSYCQKRRCLECAIGSALIKPVD
jgi:hypothetical protein